MHNFFCNLAATLGTLFWLAFMADAQGQQTPTADERLAREFLFANEFRPSCETFEICEALRAKDYQKAIELCDTFLGKDIKAFEDERGRNASRSLTYRLRAFARVYAGGSTKESIEDEISAADLGNPDAARHVVELFVKLHYGILKIPGLDVSRPTLHRYARLGAELGDRTSITLLGTLPFALSADEKTYWQLLTVVVGSLTTDGKPSTLTERSLLLKKLIPKMERPM